MDSKQTRKTFSKSDWESNGISMGNISHGYFMGIEYGNVGFNRIFSSYKPFIFRLMVHIFMILGLMECESNI